MIPFSFKNINFFQKSGCDWKENILYGEYKIGEEALYKDLNKVFADAKPVILKYSEKGIDGCYRLVHSLSKEAALVIQVVLHDLDEEDFLKGITPLITTLSSLLLSGKTVETPKKINLPVNREKKVGSIEKNLRQWISSYDLTNDGKLYEFLTSQMDMVLLPIVLEMYDFNKSKTSKILGINRNTLRKKMIDLGIS